jgi:predicted secreted Zn-dependent protease
MLIRIRSAIFTALLALSSVRFVACARPSIPVPANPGMGVTLQQVTTDYEVTGTSVRELNLSIARNARTQPDQTSYGGFTIWNLRFSYAGSRTVPGGCRPNGVNVYLDLSVRYPVWKDSAAAAASVREEWNRYVTALKAHEGNHAAIDIRGANRLASGLRDLVSPICRTLQADAQTVATTAMQWIRSENGLYDERTRHGATEGASLQDHIP